MDSLKKSFPKGKKWTLRTFFENYYGSQLRRAQKHFAESLAGYSLFNYLFNIKDRHNGNILLDSNGRLIHIDFGFMLQSSPGKISFEGAPFKLTKEYVEIMDGLSGQSFKYFKNMLASGLFEIRKNLDEILILVEIMMKHSKLPCFVKPAKVLGEIKSRATPRSATDSSKTVECDELIDSLVKTSNNNYRTNQYDSFQKLRHNIEK